ncbi:MULTISPECIES: family 20 glycosylhydrolase [unclassified Pseudoalteromonas]|uniref:family 20 glycosylhydrolase n=1 Tax=unclassified Pseudoalteromonas TaxID=194690 RepID=UPI000C071DFB|nr:MULTISPECIES: family 20 glycosylhydrolase [unclassified Pseudoalteromonas]MDP2634943.1 family 20 glycosylhydrolase [Pseudoalteromonas sp. 1_MG-2023]PHN89186.1 beta-N-acetylhexosaminidase [Pseudoalteromonas sp. 3D05]
MPRTILLLLAMCSATAFAKPPSQVELDTLAQHLSVKYELLSAKPKACPAPHQTQCYLSRLTFNTPFDVDSRQWSIYFSQLMPIYNADSSQFTITHINGDLHQVNPTVAFTGFKANTPLSIEFYTQESQITRSEFMPNYMLASKGLTSRIISSTKTTIDAETKLELQPYLAPFLTLEQLHTSKDDATPWMGAEYLYKNETRPTFNKAPLSLIPKPVDLTLLSGEMVDLSQGLNLQLDDTNRAQLSSVLARLASFGIEQHSQGIATTIKLDLDADNPEAYTLKVQHDQITINAKTMAGGFYALQSIAGLVSLDNLTIPALNITDAPRYAFRGMHIDVARNFRSKEFILNTIEQMAAYKLNKLHLHLADDEGWRLAIKDLPELTDIGAKRCLDLTEQTCLLPQLGAGLDSSSMVNGYYSQADYIDILKYAQAHFIEVIPSLDMPGHSRAAIVAMEARFNRLMAQDKHTEALQYRLVEPADKTQYSSIQHYSDNTLNVCLDSTYEFIDKVLDEVNALHIKAGVPFKTYHIGADETAGAWVDSPSCKALKAQQPALHSFNGYFIEKVSSLVASKGLKVAGWSDGMSDVNIAKMPNNVQSNAWATLSEGGHEVAHRHANQGWDVVLSSPDVTYFDFPYQSHPQERGNHWASRAIDSKKVFEFMPDNLPAHAEIWQSVKSQNYSADDRQSMRTKSFYGLQGHLWSELLRSDTQTEYMLYPRLLALAERAWHKAPWELEYNKKGVKYDQNSEHFNTNLKQQAEADWQRFAALVGFKEFAKLEQAGRFYRLPSVAARYINNSVDAFTPYPGLAIEYQDSDGKWLKYEFDSKPVSAQQIRVISINGERKGRALEL